MNMTGNAIDLKRMVPRQVALQNVQRLPTV
jgi:hypothetical protein